MHSEAAVFSKPSYSALLLIFLTLMHHGGGDLLDDFILLSKTFLLLHFQLKVTHYLPCRLQGIFLILVFAVYISRLVFLHHGVVLVLVIKEHLSFTRCRCCTRYCCCFWHLTT